MTTSPLNRIKLLIVCVFAAGGLLLAMSASSAHAQGNSAIDQYLENNPDGGAYHGPKKGGSGGGSANPGSGGGSSSSSGSGSGGSGSGDEHATKDYNGDGTIDSTDDKIAAKKKAKKEKDKKDDVQTSGVGGSGDDGGSGGSSSSTQRASQSVPADDGGGSSGALWIVLALLVLAPAAVFAFLRFGPRGRKGSEPQGTEARAARAAS